MKTRVTITLKPDVHREAKALARNKKTTVSGLIESLLNTSGLESKAGSLVDSMIGSATARTVPQGTDLLFDALSRKYLTPKGSKKHARSH